MRLRNIPAAANAIAESEYCVLDYTEHKGEWKEIFGNSHPLAMEIGMGKGRFLMDLARQNPEINYLGVERYGSVLYRALQKIEEYPWTTSVFCALTQRFFRKFLQKANWIRFT